MLAYSHSPLLPCASANHHSTPPPSSLAHPAPHRTPNARRLARRQAHRTPARTPLLSGAQQSSLQTCASSVQAQTPTSTSQDWQASFAQSASQPDASGFISMEFRGKIGPELKWRQATVRPIVLKRKPHLQFSYFDATKNIVKNAQPGSEEASQRLTELLLLPFSNALMRTMTQDTIVKVGKNGKAAVHTMAPTKPAGPISLEHNRVKDLPLPPQVPHPFLQRIGLQTAEGKVKAGMHDKFTQVNEFLKLLKHTNLFDDLTEKEVSAADASSSSSSSNGSKSKSRAANEPESSSTPSSPSPSSSRPEPLRILDCGCGSSHLTFGLWHYTRNVLGVHTQITGVDSNAALMAKSNRYCQELGMAETDAHFVASSIAEYQPPQGQRPDIVLALHACDTATDEALALAVKQGAPVIMAVPCCHKHMHRQIAEQPADSLPSQFSPMMSQGIVRQRFIDLLTDTLRACILRILGYKVDIIEFVSTEHTPRNILIRAIKSKKESSSASIADNDSSASLSQQEYLSLQGFWGVRPYLATLLQTELCGKL